MTFDEQDRTMRAHWPAFSSSIGDRYGIWSGWLHPHGFGYAIRVTYSFGENTGGRIILPTYGRNRDGRLQIEPVAEIMFPYLSARDGHSGIPHLYDRGPPARPCLYFPGDGDWDPTIPIATSIVHYLCAWLSAYEFWHVTGQWTWPETHAGLGDEGVDEWNRRLQRRLKKLAVPRQSEQINEPDYPGLKIGNFEYFQLTAAASKASFPLDSSLVLNKNLRKGEASQAILISLLERQQAA
jgi:hypothetical protein